MSPIQIRMFPSGVDDTYADIVAADYAAVIDDARESMVINALTQLAARGRNGSTRLHDDGRISYEDLDGGTNTIAGRHDVGDLERAAASGWLRLENPDESGAREATITGLGLDRVNSVRARLGWALFDARADLD